MSATRRSWLALRKFADDRPLTDREWDDLSAITLIDRTRLFFGPGNCRWAETNAERAANLAFYKSCGQPLKVH